MVFGIDDALGIASAAASVMGAGKGKTRTEQPIYDPRANELLDLLTGRAKGLMETPYQSPALLRYNPTSVFQQSPVLQAIQDAVDRSMTVAGQGGSSQPNPAPAPTQQQGMQFDNPFFKGFAEGDPRKGTMAEAYSGNSFMRALGKMGGVAPMAAYWSSMRPQQGQQPQMAPQGGQPQDIRQMIDMLEGPSPDGTRMDGTKVGTPSLNERYGPRNPAQAYANPLGGGNYIGNILKSLGQ